MWQLAIPLVLGGIQSLYGASQKSKAEKALDEINKTPYPTYETGESIYSRATRDSRGLSLQEIAQAQQRQNRISNQTYRTIFNKNPTLSGVANAIANDQSTNFNLGIAAQDSMARRQNLQFLTGFYGNQSNAQTQANIQYRNQLESQYGLASQNGTQNIFTGLNTALAPTYSYFLNRNMGKTNGNDNFNGNSM